MDMLAGSVGFVTGYILPFLVVLTLIVFVHEMGHYLAGRWSGIGITAFSVDPSRPLGGAKPPASALEA